MCAIWEKTESLNGNKVSGRRPRGRPRMRWVDGAKLAISERGVSFAEAKELTGDRKRLRDFILNKHEFRIYY